MHTVVFSGHGGTNKSGAGTVLKTLYRYSSSSGSTILLPSIRMARSLRVLNSERRVGFW